MRKLIPILLIGILILSGFGSGAFQINEVKPEELNQLFSNKKIDKMYVESFFLDDISWTKHNVHSNFNCAGIYSSDLDEDGDKDILAASAMLNEIAWWRNDGGDPIVWTKHTIVDKFEGAAYSYPVDMDDDGDDDVLGAAWYDNEVAWWRNDGGDPIVWTKKTIKTSYVNAHEVYAYDMDDDGDIDVLGASAGLDEITWWRNDGGSPISWVEQKIGDCFGARSVYVTDIDSDENIDVLGADFTTNKIILWLNDGGDPIVWTKTIIDNFFAGAHHVHAFDVDDDGDPDVLGAAYIHDDISWWRNDGGDPIVWTEQKIDDMFNGALRVDVADIDDDGDADILGSADLSNCIAWWRNDGGDPIVWTKKTIDTMCFGAWPLHVSDVDDDGDVDVIGGGTTGISWYENSLYPKCDLEGEGSLSWVDVQPGDTVMGSFTVENAGSKGSLLDWEIESYPNWGKWTITPPSGQNLTPEDGQFTVDVEVIAPDGNNKEFTGEVTIVNTDDHSDSCTIDVSLATPKNKLFIHNLPLLNWLFERFPNLFPILRQLLGL